MQGGGMRIARGHMPPPQSGGQQQGQGQGWGGPPPPNQYQPQRGGPVRNYGNEMGAAYGSYTVSAWGKSKGAFDSKTTSDL